VTHLLSRKACQRRAFIAAELCCDLGALGSVWLCLASLGLYIVHLLCDLNDLCSLTLIPMTARENGVRYSAISMTPVSD